MDNKSPKVKKRVSFGRAEVRLVFDYYNQDSTQIDDTSKKSSREIMTHVIPTQPQKPPKSILKPSSRAVSVDSGLNALQRVPRTRFEWEQMDRNFWEPGRYKGRKKTRQDSNDNKDRKSIIDSLNEDGKTDVKDENNNFIKDEMNVASSGVDSEQEKPRIKNNEKWCGMTPSYAEGVASSKFVGIYSGVEADWDQTRQSLARIGIDIAENSLQNPREFVAIMNMFLSKENQSVHEIEQENTAVKRPTELQHANDESIKKEQQKTVPGNEKEPVIEEEISSTKLDTTYKNKKQASSKEELKRRMKKLKMKGLIPRKKDNSSKARKERSYSENSLNCLPETDIKVKNYEQHSSFEKENYEKQKRRGPKRRESQGSLDYFGKFEVQRNGKKDQSVSTEDLNSDTDHEGTSTDSSSTLNNDHYYSDNNLDLPKRVSVDSVLRRERSSTCPTEGSHVEDDLKQNSERPTVVKRDSWFLTKKQKIQNELRKEKSNLSEEQKVIDRNDQHKNIDSERHFREGISQKKASGKISRDTIEKKTCEEVQMLSDVKVNAKAGSTLENERKNEKPTMESKPGAKLENESKPKDRQNEKRDDDVFSESQMINKQRKQHPEQVKEDSMSRLDRKNKSSKPKDYKKTDDVPASKGKITLLTIANQSESEKEDSGLSSSTSYDTINHPGNEGCGSVASNIVQTNTERKNPVEQPKSVSGDVKECRAIAEEPKTTKIQETKEQKEVNQEEKTTHVDEAAMPSQDAVEEEQKQTNKSIENKENVSCKTEMYTNTDEIEDQINKKFQNDIQFIDWETKRSLRSEEYLERARKRYHPKPNKQNIAQVVIEAISKNPAAGVILPFSN